MKGGMLAGGMADDMAANRSVAMEAELARRQLEQQAERDYQDNMSRREQTARASAEQAL